MVSLERDVPMYQGRASSFGSPLPLPIYSTEPLVIYSQPKHDDARRDARLSSLRKHLLPQMTRSSTLDTVQALVHFICTIDSHVDRRVLVDVAEGQTRGDDEFFRLKACMARIERVTSRVLSWGVMRRCIRMQGTGGFSMDEPVGMNTRCRFTSCPCATIRSTT